MQNEWPDILHSSPPIFERLNILCSHLHFGFCPRVPVHKSRYKEPNNTQQLTNDSNQWQWLFPCEPVHQRGQNRILTTVRSQLISSSTHLNELKTTQKCGVKHILHPLTFRCLPFSGFWYSATVNSVFSQNHWQNWTSIRRKWFGVKAHGKVNSKRTRAGGMGVRGSLLW